MTVVEGAAGGSFDGLRAVGKQVPSAPAPHVGADGDEEIAVPRDQNGSGNLTRTQPGPQVQGTNGLGSSTSGLGVGQAAEQGNALVARHMVEETRVDVLDGADRASPGLLFWGVSSERCN